MGLVGKFKYSLVFKSLHLFIFPSINQFVHKLSSLLVKEVVRESKRAIAFPKKL